MILVLPPTMLKRSLIVVHRWLGVALCLLFLLWFPSGIVMMYWDFPSVTAADRLARSPALDPSTVVVPPSEAIAVLKTPSAAPQIRLNIFDGRPVYRVRSGRGETVVYADTGQIRDAMSQEMLDRIAAAWANQPLGAARIDPIGVDQWTVQGSFRPLAPIWKYSWPDGQEVYLSQTTGDVVQYTTRASRLGAYFGAIPHWFYFTPLRANQPRWSRFVIWSSGLATVSSLVGIVIGVWMYSPSKRYRHDGRPRRLPYRGAKRWHTIVGLIFGLGAATWAFSGMLSMDPFPSQAPRRGGDDTVAQALRGRVPMTAVTKHPREALSQLAGLQVKELEIASFAGEPVYLATIAPGDTRIVPMNGDPQIEFDRRRIASIVADATRASGGAQISVLDRYDRYYLDRHRSRPLPVVLARLNDAAHTRYYIDPKTARVAGTYSARSWMSRWAYHGLHSLDFPWLYDHRPAWDIVVIAFMIGGTALCVTSLVLAWRVLGRKARALVPASRVRSELSEDLA